MKYYSILLLSILFAASSCGTSEQKCSSTCPSAQEIKASKNDAIVSISSGKIAGYIDHSIYTFKGIPYAKAERFMPPTAVEPWEGVRSSRAYGASSPQGERMGWYSDEQAFAFQWDDGFTNENCQHLNVWSQGINDGAKRPVMVWLHGGGFSAGSSQELPSYDGASLAQTGDVVMVSINHRLNVLGFLDLSGFGGAYAEAANVGMKDVVAALEWVKANIAQFGGDPNNVTIFGQSGGGGKVTSLLSSPMAKGLFHKAIIQSGAMVSTMEAETSQAIGKRTVKMLGGLEKAKTVPYTELLATANKAVADLRAEAVKNGFEGFIFGFAPTIDGEYMVAQPSAPEILALNADVPVMMGTTVHEFMGSMFIPGGKDEDFINAIKKRYGEKADDYMTAFGEAYPNYKAKDLLDVDMNFRLNTWKYANMRSAASKAPVYSYIFAWESPVLDGVFRSFHCMELPFVFNNIDRCRAMTGGSADAYALAEKVSGAWLAFAKTGDPSTAELPEWAAYTQANGANMIFNNTCEVKYNHDKKLLEIADQFPKTSF